MGYATALVYHQANQDNAAWCMDELAQQAEWWRKWRRYFQERRLADLVVEIHTTTRKRNALYRNMIVSKDKGVHVYAAAIYQLRTNLVETRNLMAKIEARLDRAPSKIERQVIPL